MRPVADGRERDDMRGRACHRSGAAAAAPSVQAALAVSYSSSKVTDGSGANVVRMLPGAAHEIVTGLVDREDDLVAAACAVEKDVHATDDERGS